jgi:protein SCO1/2
MTRSACLFAALFVLSTATTCGRAPAAPVRPERTAPRLSGRSIYNLEIALTDQRGAQLNLETLRGHPVMIAMFYASCTTICPMLIEDIKHIDASLDAGVRQQTRVVLITLDPEHDSVDRLAELAKLHGIDDERWHFARTDDGTLRDIAALLGIAFSPSGGGQFSHSANIALSNRDGEIVVQLQASPASATEISSAIAKLVKAPLDS